MSEYSASAPVIDRNTVPMSARPAWLSPLTRNWMPCTGFSARSTSRFCDMLIAPVTAMNRNQTSTVEPNTLPMRSVPRDCTANTARMITSAMNSVRLGFSSNTPCNAGSVCRPSTAELIDIAGVSTESARNAAPPIIAGTMSHLPYLRSNEYNAKMPPSPLLSTRMQMSTYSTVVMSVIVQNTRESMPMTAVSSACCTPP